MIAQGRLIILLVVAVFLSSLQGCVSVQSFPTAARAGDTITLAVGSQDGLTANTVQVLYFAEGQSTSRDLTPNIRSVFKVMPDKTSYTWQYKAGDLNAYSGHRPWLNVIALDLPEDLPVGNGYFKIVLGDTVIEPNPSYVAPVEPEQIAVEILPGDGSPSLFQYKPYAFFSSPSNGNLGDLESIRRVVLRYIGDPNYNGEEVAAAEYRIKIPVNGDPADLSDSDIRVVWDDKPGDEIMQVQLSWSRQYDELTVNVVTNAPPGTQYRVKRIRFSVMVASNGLDSAVAPQLLSYRYFDLYGNKITPVSVPEVVFMHR
ncbi:MAG TPA: hypothetical protein VIQ81_05245 [Gammaproteobacteria bacterium]